MFERNDAARDQLTYVRRLVLPSSTLNQVASRRTSTEIIHALALSPNEETLLAATNGNQLFEIVFSKLVCAVERERPRMFRASRTIAKRKRRCSIEQCPVHIKE